MAAIAFEEAFPGMVMSTLFLSFALIDYGVAATAVNNNASLAPDFFATPLPLFGTVKSILPLSMPLLLLKLLKEDVIGLFSGISFQKVLGTIVFTVGKRWIPAIEALKDGMTPAEAYDLYKHATTMLILNAIMFVSGLIKTRLGATKSPISGEKTKDA